MVNLLVKIFWRTLPIIILLTVLAVGFFGIPAAPIKIHKEIWPHERR